MSFPWSVLITGASTLLAGLGGAGLKERFDRGRENRGQRSKAYADLMLSLDEVNRLLRDPSTLKPELVTGTVGEAVGRAIDAVQRAYFAVYLIGSRTVQPVAGAAWDLHQWIHHESARSADTNLGGLFDKLRVTSEAFAEAARAEVRRLRPLPPTARARAVLTVYPSRGG